MEARNGTKNDPVYIICRSGSRAREACEKFLAAGYDNVAAGLLRGDHPQIDLEAVMNAPTDQRPFILDVRTPQEFSAGHITGAVNIPVDELRPRLGEIPRGKAIAVYCQVGQRGYLATRVLLHAGFPAVNIGGGYKTFQLFRSE
jgi:rhodanese-related sulfurtransferase